MHTTTLRWMVGTMLMLAVPVSAGAAQAAIGKPAPDFTLRDTSGEVRTLSQLTG